jgi:hypothetical protein
MSVFTAKVLQGAEPPQSGDNTQVMRILVVRTITTFWLSDFFSEVFAESGRWLRV